MRHLSETLTDWFASDECRSLLATHLAGFKTASAVPAAFAAHLENVLMALRARAWNEIFAPHSQLVGDARRRAHFAVRVAAMHASENVAAQDFVAGFDACIAAELSNSRQQFAQAVVAELSPQVALRQLVLSEAQIEALIDQPGDPEALLSAPKRLRLEESRALYADHRDVLLAEARSVAERQMSLVNQRDRVQWFQAEVQALDAANRTLDAKVGLVNRYRDEVREQWQRERLEVVADTRANDADSERYLPLLRSIDDEIEKVITLEWALGETMAMGQQGAPDSSMTTVAGEQQHAAGSAEAELLQADAPLPDDVPILGECTALVCADAAAACACFVNGCGADGRCVSAVEPWRLACLDFAAQCASASQ